MFCIQSVSLSGTTSDADFMPSQAPALTLPTWGIRLLVTQAFS